MASPDPATLRLPNDFIPETKQICIVTRDLDAMVRRYADKLGIGPWWVNEYRPPELTDTTYRGEPSTFSMRLALAWTGVLNWEIIQPLEGPSIYHDFLERNEEGMQHVGILLSDLGMTWDECHEAFEARLRADHGRALEARPLLLLRHVRGHRHHHRGDRPARRF